MKKLLLTLVTLVTATAASAQIVLWDGEDATITSKNNAGWWDRGNPTLVDNPEKDGINTSKKCLKFTMTGDGNKQVALPFRDWITPDLKGNRRLSFMIKKVENDNVLVELSDPTNGAANYWQKVAAWYGGDGKWQKVVLDFSKNDGLNDFPGVFAITAQTGSVKSNQDVYIDNIVIEPVPMVGEKALKDITDGSLKGNITLSGSYMKGDCQNANGDPWVKVEYNDFATLEAKLGDNAVTSVDMRGTILKDAYNSTRGKNPNCIVYADAFFDKNNENVVASGATSKLILNDAHPFYSPIEFTAASVELKRGVKNGINTFCLPFAVTPSEVSETKIATFKGGVTFTTADNVNANTPFITVDAKAVDKETGFTFSNKTITATPASLGTTFEGTYKRLSDTTGMYGINKDGKFEVGSTEVPCSAFRAYLTTIPSTARSIDIDGETTGISNVSLENPVKEIYNLNGVRVDKIGQKGIYIINGKKVIVK